MWSRMAFRGEVCWVYVEECGREGLCVIGICVFRGLRGEWYGDVWLIINRVEPQGLRGR